MDAEGEHDHGHDLVVVPDRPGPLVGLDQARRRRERDDLDDLIDDFVPEVDDAPGWFDLLLVVTGIGLTAWAALGDPPAFAAAAGIAALGLGVILPARTAWRRVRRRRDDRRRAALLRRGVPLAVSSPGVAALVGMYGDLVEIAGRIPPDVATPALSAGHGAVAEVATLLGWRAPASDRELAYVEARAEAVTGLVAALRPLIRSSEAPVLGPIEEGPAVDPETLVRARDELDEIAASSSVARIDELAAELRDRDHGHR